MGSKMELEVHGRREKNPALAGLELGKGEMFRTKEGMGEGWHWRKCLGYVMVGGAGVCWGAARVRVPKLKGGLRLWDRKGYALLKAFKYLNSLLGSGSSHICLILPRSLCLCSLFLMSRIWYYYSKVQLLLLTIQ